ncbi:MAG: hypothetical protein KJ072_20125 [Verrucomicrobia bacterium]|nr:hypothetical protein [Verrucomicrobiota bacterium]
MMSARRLLTRAVATCFLITALDCLAAEGPAANTSDAAIRRKLEEIERLKSDLMKAEQELRRLQPKGSAASPATPGTQPGLAAPSSGLADLPALTPETIVGVDALAAHFRADRAAAEARYHQQTFSIKGNVTRFNPRVARRSYDLIFEPAERAPLIVAQFDYREHYRAVYTRDNGQSLFARISERDESLLFHTGDSILIRGRCAVMKDGTVRLTRCTTIGG